MTLRNRYQSVTHDSLPHRSRYDYRCGCLRCRGRVLFGGELCAKQDTGASLCLEGRVRKKIERYIRGPGGEPKPNGEVERVPGHSLGYQDIGSSFPTRPPTLTRIQNGTQ